LSVYDGRDQIGSVVARGKSVDAFDRSGVHLGTFPTLKAASAALSGPRDSSCVRDHSGRGGSNG
jgi:hypothetical protein